MTMNTPRPREAIPNSAGTEPPKLEAPPGACDCHMRIYDAARFPPARPGSHACANASARRTIGVPAGDGIGAERAVIVQPAAYSGTDQSRHARRHRAALGNALRRGGAASDVSDA